jgi:hypothetical protein
MARNKYPDGTHRMWVRISDEAEAELRHLAIDLRADSVEVLAGQLIKEAAAARRRDVGRKDSPKKPKR